jgi:hypothetical protein
MIEQIMWILFWGILVFLVVYVGLVLLDEDLKAKMKFIRDNALVLLSFVWVLIVFSGCAVISYEQENGKETLNVTTFLKSIDGLAAERDEDGFTIIIDKTYTHDPTRALADLMETYQQLYGMGIRFDPDAILDPPE